MARHEEKYLLTYAQYALLRARVQQVFSPDPHGQGGTYVINSLYFDDPADTALDEKLDGHATHTKFRARCYDYSDGIIKLERKDKTGIMTEKCAASITRQQLLQLNGTATQRQELSAAAQDLAVQLQATHLQPAAVVRYTRDAYYYPGTDVRITFDRELEVLPADPNALFDPQLRGLGVLDGNTVILEIKYGLRLPGFVRKLTNISTKQLSVSKYALCRLAHRTKESL